MFRARISGTSDQGVFVGPRWSGHVGRATLAGLHRPLLHFSRAKTCAPQPSRRAEFSGLGVPASAGDTHLHFIRASLVLFVEFYPYCADRTDTHGSRLLTINILGHFFFYDSRIFHSGHQYL